MTTRQENEMTNSLQDKVVIVTGAGRGIGRELLAALVEFDDLAFGVAEAGAGAGDGHLDEVFVVDAVAEAGEGDGELDAFAVTAAGVEPLRVEQRAEADEAVAAEAARDGEEDGGEAAGDIGGCRGAHV